MKYINKFSTNADYQAFTEGGGYVTPNICYVEENEGLVFKPEKPSVKLNNLITWAYKFPLTLAYNDGATLPETDIMATYPVESDLLIKFTNNRYADKLYSTNHEYTLKKGDYLVKTSGVVNAGSASIDNISITPTTDDAYNYILDLTF